jgi:hypothetical protein
MPYFSYISFSYVAKNAMQKEVYEFLKKNNRQIIASLEIENFKNEIIAGIKAIEEKHPRCKTLGAHWSEVHKLDEGDITLYLSNGPVCSYHLYAGAK